MNTDESHDVRQNWRKRVSQIGPYVLMVLSILVSLYATWGSKIPGFEDLLGEALNAEKGYHGLFAVVTFLIGNTWLILEKMVKLERSVGAIEANHRDLVKTVGDMRDNFKYHDLRIINFSKDKGAFSGFHGIFHAFNAPMSWECGIGKNDALEMHKGRYRDPRFKEARYYYPIFACLSDADKKTWAKRLLDFFGSLDRALAKNEIAKSKLRFYWPNERSSFVVADDWKYSMTFFHGCRISGPQVIYYQHNGIFQNTNDVTVFAFLVHEKDFCEHLEQLCNKSEMQARLKELNLGEFLEALGKIVQS